MIVAAHFFRGPFDGQILTLPEEAVSEIFVIPQFDPITIEFMYLLAGELDRHTIAYLYNYDSV